MAIFKIMDIENWERKEHYHHYSNITQCTYGITIKLEVSNKVLSHNDLLHSKNRK